MGDCASVAADLIPNLGTVSVEATGIASGDHVLDVAAGCGNASLPAAARGAHVVASDLTPELFESGRQAAASHGLTHQPALHLRDRADPQPRRVTHRGSNDFRSQRRAPTGRPQTVVVADWGSSRSLPTAPPRSPRCAPPPTSRCRTAVSGILPRRSRHASPPSMRGSPRPQSAITSWLSATDTGASKRVPFSVYVWSRSGSCHGPGHRIGASPTTTWVPARLRTRPWPVVVGPRPPQ